MHYIIAVTQAPIAADSFVNIVADSSLADFFFSTLFSAFYFVCLTISNSHSSFDSNFKPNRVAWSVENYANVYWFSLFVFIAMRMRHKYSRDDGLERCFICLTAVWRLVKPLRRWNMLRGSSYSWSLWLSLSPSPSQSLDIDLTPQQRTGIDDQLQNALS